MKIGLVVMTKQATITILPINIGSQADDGTGDNLRLAFEKVNTNFYNLNAGLVNNFNFVNLLDTPENYSSNSLVTVAQTGNVLVYRNLISSDLDISITNNTINLRLAETQANTHTFSEDVYFVKDIHVQGNTIVKDTYINVEVLRTENQLIVSNSTPATSTTTGALTVAGGVGVQGNVYATNFNGTVLGTVSSLSNHTTDDLSEGTTNLYYTTARAKSASVAGNDTEIIFNDSGVPGASANLTFNGTQLAVTGNVNVNGAILASGDITAFSDARLKTNIETIENALFIVDNLRGVNFNRIDTGEAGSGVIAQEVQLHMPMLVKESNDGTLSVNYGAFAGLFIESIKALEKQILELKEEIAQLKGQQ